jgi:DNA-binding beta-propeller fold protein YncE
LFVAASFDEADPAAQFGGDSIVKDSTLSAAIAAALVSSTLIAGLPGAARGDDLIPDNSGAAPLPTGQLITTGAIPGAVFTNMTVNIPTLTNPVVGPDGAIQSALNPADGKTLVVMTSGYNTYDTATGASAPASYNGVSGPEYIFVFDTTNPAAPVRNLNPLGQTGTTTPAAALTPQDTFQGMLWSPDGTKLYVSGGTDATVYIYSFNLSTKTFSGPTSIVLVPAVGVPAPPDADANGIGNNDYLGPQTSGLALDPTGRYLVALNCLNDSMSVIDTTTNTIVVDRYDLRPYNTTPATGNGVAGGEEPYGVAVSADGKRAYISSIRDREIAVVDISQAAAGTVSLITRIPVAGSPNNMVLKAATGELFVAEDNSDQVAVIDTNPSSPTYDTVTQTIDAIAPPGTFPAGAPRFTGAATNNVALSPDGSTLYVTNGGANDVAIVPLTRVGPYQVAGLIPTGWYPTTVTPSFDGSTLYIFNSKSDPGSNPLHQTTSVTSERYTKYSGISGSALAYGGDQYVFELEQSGFLTVPLASVTGNLPALTAQVAANNGWSTGSISPSPTMQFLRQNIKHVIYIVKENRTFDQVLGDLTNGANADPALTVFGKQITPNFHRIATNFVTLDNFFVPAEVSGNGWPWSTEARETDWNEKSIPMDYTFGYGSYSKPVVTRSNAPYDAEGQNANVSVGYDVFNADGSYDAADTVTLRTLEGGGFTYSDTTTYTNSGNALPGGAINLRPGPANPGEADGAYAFNGTPANSPYQSGHLWDAALNAGLTVRNYGFFSDNNHYGLSSTAVGYVAPLQNPEAAGCQSAIPLTAAQAYPAGAQQEWTAAKALIPYTDACFHGFDNAYPDAWRFQEFQREFTKFVANNNLPNLVFLRYMHDHMGNFGSTAGASVNFPEAQQADNDYAVGATLDMLAHSPYAGNTLVFVVEDDAQDGPDHMDAHRTTAYVVGPYVKQHAVVSMRYSTVNMVRTIEDVLGLQHVNLFTAYQPSMDAVFNVTQGPAWTYTHLVSSVLSSTGLAGTLSSLSPASPVRYADAAKYKLPHSPAWWRARVAGFDFSSEDRIPVDEFNRVIWEGMKGKKPYPKHRSRKVMRTLYPETADAAGPGPVRF